MLLTIQELFSIIHDVLNESSRLSFSDASALTIEIARRAGLLEETLDPHQRALEKAASREADERALKAGEKTREDLRRENSFFSFPPGRIRIDMTKVKVPR